MSDYSELKPDFNKGLLTAVLQHHTNKNVLMVGYMDEEAFRRTCAEGVVWFFSRSKGRLWMKGESSGHVQIVKDMRLDCDSDALLVQVDPQGPTCHRNTESCFDLDISFTLKDLEDTVRERAENPEEGSYTNYLLTSGTDKIAKKFGEESFEAVIAAKNEDREELANEAADVLYHLSVLLFERGVSISDVEKVLHARHMKKKNFKGTRREVEEY